MLAHRADSQPDRRLEEDDVGEATATNMIQTSRLRSPKTVSRKSPTAGIESRKSIVTFGTGSTSPVGIPPG